MILDEQFRQRNFDSRLEWLNPPAHWQVLPDAGGLVVEPKGHTDFWQQTHYGFRVDNGHFLGMTVEGDFVLSTRVAFHPLHQYDQAGLMIRSDSNCWLKASVEHEVHGAPQLGAVVTARGFSDWSLQDLAAEEREIELRLCKRAQNLTAEYRAVNQGAWKLMRVAHWHAPADLPVDAGLYACSPKGEGFKAEFKFMQIVR